MLNRNKNIKFKQLKYKQSSIYTGKILMCVTFLLFFLMCVYLIVHLPIESISNLTFTYGNEKVSMSDSFDLLRTIIPLFVFIWSTAISVIISFTTYLLTVYPKFLLSDEISESLKMLLQNTPSVKITNIDTNNIEMSIESDKTYRLLSFCDNTALIDYGSKHNSEIVNIQLKNFCQANDKTTISLIISTNNFYKTVVSISFESKGNTVKENSLKINYYYISEKELKRWCKINQLVYPLDE